MMSEQRAIDDGRCRRAIGSGDACAFVMRFTPLRGGYAIHCPIIGSDQSSLSKPADHFPALLGAVFFENFRGRTHPPTVDPQERLCKGKHRSRRGWFELTRSDSYQALPDDRLVSDDTPLRFADLELSAIAPARTAPPSSNVIAHPSDQQ